MFSAPLRAPKWYNNRAGVSFGFGGKLVSFHCDESPEVSEGTLIVDFSCVCYICVTTSPLSRSMSKI